MIVKIDKLSHDFRGIGKIDNKIVFVDRALPCEVVDISVTYEKKKFYNGIINSVIKSNSSRVDCICPYYGICGGCSTSHIRFDKALEFKRDIVIDIMKRYANLDISSSIISDYNEYGYRNKISFRVFNGRLALNKEGSSDLINVDRCYLVNDSISRVMDILNGISLFGLDEVVIRGNKDIMVILYGDIASDIIIDRLRDSVSSIVLNDKVIYGNDYILFDIGYFKYAVYPKSFFQVNTGMISKLYDKVLEYAGTGDSLLDLYCGSGTIGIYLSGNFNRVRGVEINYDAIVGANLNKKINGIDNIVFECMSTSDIGDINEEVVVVDPPRSGLDKKTLNALFSSGAKRIVYVSCNPITLARDINLLKDRYFLDDITLFDMFPNTKHVESVSVLQLKSLEK